MPPSPPSPSCSLFALALGALLAALSGCGKASSRPEPSPAGAAAFAAEAEQRAPPGVYSVTAERVSDTCTPPRYVGPSGSHLLLTGSKHDDKGWMLGLPPIPGAADPNRSMPSARRYDFALYPHKIPFVDTEIPGCGGAKIHALHGFDAFTADGFTLRVVEEWPEPSGCTSPPPDLPAHACRSERTIRYRLEQPCRAPCKVQIADDAGPSGCACPP